MMNLSKLTEIKDLREIWPHEAHDFTPWLATEENIGLLSDAIGIDITVDETESDVGDFNVDILASETGTGRRIIIENQLEDTNHDHLGKLITYASGKDAEIIVWLVKHAREEHRSAIEWLNNHTDDKFNFFLCEIKLYRIGDSNPAVKFEVIEKPNEWTKEVKKAVGTTDVMQKRLEYWTAFNEYAFNNKAFASAFKKKKPSTDHWMVLTIGSSECHIALLQVRKEGKIFVEFYIYENKELFHSLFEKKEEIESEIGSELDWRELPERKASRVLIGHEIDFENKDEWQTQFDWLIDKAVKMKKAIKKYI